MDARLQAESSRNMYSEHGFEALIRAVFLQGCQRFTVVSNCIPGSPHWCVASAICRIRSAALCRFTGWPVATLRVHQSSSRTTASMKSSVARTLLRSEEHTSELQSRENLVCRLLLEKK